MDEICRLCLTVSLEMSCKISEESKILDHLSSLNIQIRLGDSLPSHVCRKCFITLEDIQNFRDSVAQNENKLFSLLNENNIDAFYQSLLNTYQPLKSIKIEAENEKNSCDIDYSEDLDQSNITTDVNKYESDEERVIDDTTFPCSVLISMEQSNKKSHRKVKSLPKAKRKKFYKNNLEINIEKTTDTIKGSLKSEENKSDLNNVESAKETSNGLSKIFIEDHKCLTCFECLNSKTDLIKHYKTAHNNYSSKNVNKSDTNNITSERNKCDKIDLCNNDENKEKIEESPPSETTKRPYYCKICGHTFPSVYSIIRHARAHSNHILHCVHGCGYSTVYRGALIDHQKRHDNDLKYKCETCGAGFHAKTWHDQHQNIHKNVRPYVCDICGVAFHIQRYLTSHRSSVHPKVVKGDRKYICPHCNTLFNNRYRLRAHLEEQKHREKISFLCDVCGKVCTSREHLKSHSYSHLELKPFSCSICNKRFANKFNLSVHKKAHAGEKHLCTTCGKHFAQRSTLRRHHKKHHPDTTEDKRSGE